tara:strand:+ start:3644 stop:4342 length:699 start_codon:yes stop_codon:yes gene_type:complete
MANGVILWEGPSQFDGEQIVAIATGLKSATSNDKTGDMIQTWIMRVDTAPHVAIKDKSDVSVCGDCTHRGSTCYVKTFHGPLNVWKAYHKGAYPRATLAEIEEVARGREARVGSYGDPAAVPIHIWRAYIKNASGHTGYTHAWRYCDPDYTEFCMASIDTPWDRPIAKMLGYRIFRVRADDNERAKNEIVCPASAEAGRKTNCAACGACGGTLAKAKADVTISAHGVSAGRF